MPASNRNGTDGAVVFLVLAAIVAGTFFGTSSSDEPDPAGTPAITAEADGTQEAAPSPTEETPPVPAGKFPPVDAAAVRAQLDSLDVRGRAPRTGYSRDQFGPDWPTNERGCDARNETLARDMTDVVFRPGSDDCIVLTGNLTCPYTGQELRFTRGETSRDIHVDHRVALSDAWQTGAQYWDHETRVRFANDPINLVAVDGPANMAKGDSNAASWLPPNKPYRCNFVAAQVREPPRV